MRYFPELAQIVQQSSRIAEQAGSPFVSSGKPVSLAAKCPLFSVQEIFSQKDKVPSRVAQFTIRAQIDSIDALGPKSLGAAGWVNSLT